MASGEFDFPQLGGEMERYHKSNKQGELQYSDTGKPIMGYRYGYADFDRPEVLQAGMANFSRSLLHASDEDRENGRLWYPKVHDAVATGIQGRRGHFLHGSEDRHLQASGLVAAVSPNMDWEASNINALDEFAGLKGHQWNTLLAIQSGDSAAAKRSQQNARDAVKGLSISRATSDSLLKAARIATGYGSVDEILTSPKSNSFAHNIHNPDDPNYVTIDGRAYDINTNRLRQWQAGRGINSWHTKNGEPTRYEHNANIVRHVGSMFGLSPSEAQAVGWEHMKRLELAHGRGGKGPLRVGQPYFDLATGRPMMGYH